VLVAPPEKDGRRIERVSGRLIATSLGEMRSRGLEQAYYAELPKELHEALRAVVPSEWIEVEVARAHYECMTALIPDPATQLEIGRDVSRRRRNSYLLRFLTTAIRTSGISPLTILRRTPSVWARVFQGGGTSVLQTAPRHVRVTVYAEPLGRISYFRSVVTGVTEAGVGVMAQSVAVSEARRASTESGELDLEVSW